MSVKAQPRPKAAQVKLASGQSVEAAIAAMAGRVAGPASRALNAAFQISGTRDALVQYSVQSTVTASIAGGQNGDVFLEYADDNAFTTNVQQVAVVGQGQTYTLAVALQGVQPMTGVLHGFIPAAKWVRLRTANNTGAPAYAYRLGQEVLL